MNNQEYYETRLKVDLPNYLKQIKQLKELPEIPRRVIACFLGNNLPNKIYSDACRIDLRPLEVREILPIFQERPLYENCVHYLNEIRRIYFSEYITAESQKEWIVGAELFQIHIKKLYLKASLYKLMEDWLSYNHLNYYFNEDMIASLVTKLIEGPHWSNSSRIVHIHDWLNKWTDKIYKRYCARKYTFNNEFIKFSKPYGSDFMRDTINRSFFELVSLFDEWFIEPCYLFDYII